MVFHRGHPGKQLPTEGGSVDGLVELSHQVSGQVGPMLGHFNFMLRPFSGLWACGARFLAYLGHRWASGFDPAPFHCGNGPADFYKLRSFFFAHCDSQSRLKQILPIRHKLFKWILVSGEN